MESAVQPSITWAWLPRKNKEFRLGTFLNPALIPKIHRNVVHIQISYLIDVFMLAHDIVNKELMHPGFLSHGRQPEVSCFLL